MSVTSVPHAVVADAVNQKVSVETIDGARYTGKLESACDRTFTCRLSAVLSRKKDGEASFSQSIVIRGDQIKFFLLPDVMRNAAFFASICDGSSPLVQQLQSSGGGAKGSKAKRFGNPKFAGKRPSSRP